MDTGKRLEHDPEFTQFNGGGVDVDRISGLPDEIIIKILSLVSVKEGARTSVLSRGWSDFWKHTHNLKLKGNKIERLKDWNTGRDKFIKMVKSVCESHKTLSLKQLSISLWSDSSKSDLRLATKCIDFAFSRRVERLTLKLEVHYRFDLEGILRESRISLMSSRCVLKSSLKELRLVKQKLSGEGVELFLRNCPLLEVLIIDEVSFRSDVEVCGGALKHFYMHNCYPRIYSVVHSHTIKVSASNLTCLKVDDISGDIVSLHNVPKLVEADFGFTQDDDAQVQTFSRALFCCISQLQSLTISLKYHHKYLLRGFPEMPKLKKLVVVYSGLCDYYDENLEPLTCLMWAAPCLQEFKLEVSNYRKIQECLWNFQLREESKQPMEFPVFERLNIAGLGHQHLKVFELVGFDDDRCAEHMKLVKWMTNKCYALEKIIIRPPKHVNEAAAEAAREIAKLIITQNFIQLPSHIQIYIL